MSKYILYILLAVYLLMSIISFIQFGLDKRKAVKGERRISERTLLQTAAQGGALGALLGMYLFRHKTLHKEFTTKIPIMLILQIALAVFCWWYF